MRDSNRRAAAIALLLGGATWIAWRAAQTDWFAGPQGGPDANSMWSLQELATIKVVANPTGGQPATYMVFGVPGPVAWLGLGALMCGLAFATRVSAFGALGLGMTWMARTATIGTVSMLTGPYGRGQFTLYGDNVTRYVSWLWIVMLIELALLIQMLCGSYAAKRAAIARGETPTSGLLDTFHTIQTSSTTRFAREAPPARSDSKN